MKNRILFLLLFLTGCSNRTGIPDGIIALDSMELILKDVIVADEYSIQYTSRDSTRPDKMKAGQELLESVFTLHHTDRKTFQASLQFYESRPDLSKKMFDSLTAYAGRNKALVYAPRPVSNAADSAKKALLKPAQRPIRRTLPRSDEKGKPIIVQ